MASAIYRGWLDHRRLSPRPHAFRYRLFMAYLDLAELDTVFAGRWLWATTRSRFALARFDRRDHVGDPDEPLDTSVRRLVAAHTGRRPTGPIRLLTHLRYFGYAFNPVSVYYCFDADDRRVDAVVAEVNNTPWGERHCYVLEGDPDSPTLRARSVKAMHVSPFHPMGLTYDWQLSPPAERLHVHMTLRPLAAAGGQGVAGDASPPIFGATLALDRAPITGPALARTLIAFPFMTAKVIAAIHWEALRLWLKRVPVHDHPGRSPTRPAPPAA